MRLWLRDNSLSTFFLVIFLGALTGQAIAGHELFNQEQVTHGDPAVSLWEYVTSSDFGNAVMENWQSEFLAVGSFAVLAIYLRQRGSPESKPVGAPHEATGVEG